MTQQQQKEDQIIVARREKSVGHLCFIGDREYFQFGEEVWWAPVINIIAWEDRRRIGAKRAYHMRTWAADLRAIKATFIAKARREALAYAQSVLAGHGQKCNFTETTPSDDLADWLETRFATGDDPNDKRPRPGDDPLLDGIYRNLVEALNYGNELMPRQ